MWTANLKPSEVNHIRVSLDRCTAEQLSSELGRAKTTIERKINEIKENDRIKNLSWYASHKKHEVKRKIKGGM